MHFHVQELIDEIAVDEPDPAAADALHEGLGGQFGEMRSMVQDDPSPSGDGTELSAIGQAPRGVPITIAEERMEELSPGLDAELRELVRAVADLETAEPGTTCGPVRSVDLTGEPHGVMV
jgi:hypothetical protein